MINGVYYRISRYPTIGHSNPYLYTNSKHLVYESGYLCSIRIPMG